MDPTTGPTDLSFTWLVSSDRAWEGDDRKEIDFGYHCHENPILIPRVHNIHIPEPTHKTQMMRMIIATVAAEQRKCTRRMHCKSFPIYVNDESMYVIRLIIKVMNLLVLNTNFNYVNKAYNLYFCLLLWKIIYEKDVHNSFAAYE